MGEFTEQSYRRVNFTKTDLQRLSDPEKIILSLLSFVVSETNALWRIFLCVKQEVGDNPAINAGVAIQRHVILRNWSAKLFEFDSAMKELGTRNDLTPELRSFIATVRDDMNAAAQGKRPKLVQYFRHESTNHTPVRAALKNLDFISESADLNFYFHEKEANSCFPLGEEVFFAARYNRYLRNNPSSPKSLEALSEWLDWNLSATKKLIYMTDEFMTKFVFQGDNPVSWEPVNIRMSRDLAASHKDRKVPILLTDKPE